MCASAKSRDEPGSLLSLCHPVCLSSVATGRCATSPFHCSEGSIITTSGFDFMEEQASIDL